MAKNFMALIDVVWSYWSHASLQEEKSVVTVLSQWVELLLATFSQVGIYQIEKCGTDAGMCIYYTIGPFVEKWAGPR